MRFVTATAASSAISDMLELARLDAGQALGERVPVAIDALVDTCVGEREEEARRAGVRVERRLDERAVVRGDERLLTRAVGNLLDNALRHGGAGSPVEVTVAVDAGEVVVSVADRGPGVAPGQQERIFDRFHRGSAAAAAGGARRAGPAWDCRSQPSSPRPTVASSRSLHRTPTAVRAPGSRCASRH